MIKGGKYTTEESIAALSMTVEEIEEIERNSPNREPIGKYGDLFCNFLKDHHPDRYDYYVSALELYNVCKAVDDEARDMMETVLVQLRAKKPRPKGDFMATVQYETAIHDQAEEIVLGEIVYKVR